MHCCGYLADASFQHLRHFPALRTIDIKWSGQHHNSKWHMPTSAALLSMPHLTQLTQFSVQGIVQPALFGSFFWQRKIFSGLPSKVNLSVVPMQTLCLSRCDQLQDSGLAALTTLQSSLHTLDLSECPKLTGSGFTALHSLTRLRALDLAGCDSDCLMGSDKKCMKRHGRVHLARDCSRRTHLCSF